MLGPETFFSLLLSLNTAYLIFVRKSYEDLKDLYIRRIFYGVSLKVSVR